MQKSIFVVALATLVLVAAASARNKGTNASGIGGSAPGKPVTSQSKTSSPPYVGSKVGGIEGGSKGGGNWPGQTKK